MRPFHTRAALWHATCGTAVATVFLAACSRDELTSPVRTGIREPGPPSHSIITSLGSYSIPIPSNNLINGDGKTPQTGTGITVPAGVYYRVRVTGTVTATGNTDYCGNPTPTGGTWGPGGTSSALQVLLWARNTDGTGTNVVNFLNMAGDSAVTDVIYASKEIEIQAGRNGILGSCDRNDGTGPRPAYFLSGGQTLVAEQVQDVVHLSATPSYIHPNDSVQFNVTRDDGGPLHVTQWHWQPDPGQTGSAANAWDAYGGWTNPKWPLRGSGTMYVYTSNGNSNAHVTAYTTFSLTVDKNVAFLGDTVTFTAIYNGAAGPASSWRWTIANSGLPNCVAGASQCIGVMPITDTLWAYAPPSTTGRVDSAYQAVTVIPASLSLTAVPQWVEPFPALDSAIFTPQWSDGLAIAASDVVGYSWSPDAQPGRTSGCGQVTSCKTAVFESGWMTVTVRRAGVTRTARAHVGIAPCPTNDRVLDDSAVVAGMSQLWTNSNPNDQTTSNRRERVGFIVIDKTTGKLGVILGNAADNTPCKSSFGTTPIPSQDSVIAGVHTHPFSHLDPLPSNCNLPSGAKYDAVTNGGPSKQDWTQIESVRGYYQNSSYKIPEYVIDYDNVYRGDPGTAKENWVDTFKFKRSSTSCTLF